MPDDYSLQPGESREHAFSGVSRQSLQSARVHVAFACGRCGTRHSDTVPALTGGLIQKTCSCGGEIKLLISPRERDAETRVTQVSAPCPDPLAELPPFLPRRRVIKGPHAGRSGKVVSTPWLGNLFHLRLTLNVPALIQSCPPGPFHVTLRDWITVWRWQTELIP